ncbi:DUF5133 domain-containing protein [Streptomyces sp. NPDC005722]
MAGGMRGTRSRSRRMCRCRDGGIPIVLMAHPVVLHMLTEEYEALRAADAGSGASGRPEARRRLEDVADALCVATGTRDVEAALATARARPPGTRPPGTRPADVPATVPEDGPSEGRPPGYAPLSAEGPNREERMTRNATPPNDPVPPSPTPSPGPTGPEPGPAPGPMPPPVGPDPLPPTPPPPGPDPVPPDPTPPGPGPEPGPLPSPGPGPQPAT